MKNINPYILLLSLLCVAAMCSAISMSAVAENYRWTMVAINPWNGVEGMAFTIGYMLKADKEISLPLAIGILLIVWWRFYALLGRIANRLRNNV